MRRGRYGKYRGNNRGYNQKRGNYNNYYYNNYDNKYNQNYNNKFNAPQHNYNNSAKAVEIEIEYAPKEVYESFKGKGTVIEREITGNEGIKFDDDLMDDGNEFANEYYQKEDIDDNEDDLEYEGDYYENDYKSDTTKDTSNSKKTYNSKNPLTFENNASFTNLVANQIKSQSNRNKYHEEISDNFINVLMIAEKPSIAKMISEVLSNGHAKQKMIGKGKILITFDGYFKGVKAKFAVSAVAGHVYTSDFLREHNDWKAVEPSELYTVPIVKLEAMKKMRMPFTLQKIATGKDVLCLWLDCDKEGENICYEVIYNCFPYMNKKRYQQIYRAKFSSLTKKDLKYAFDNISEPPNLYESLSVDCRQVIDLKIGVSFTRFLTSSILPSLNLSDSYKILSYGPCQTPTLWFCVERQKEIENFVSKEYYKPYVELEINMFRHKLYYAKNIFDNKELSKIMSKLKGAENAVVKQVLLEHNTKSAPVGMNTVNMLRAASSFLKMSPHDTMVVAEKLYTMGYITYPRTETTKYASSFDFAGALAQFQKHPSFGNNVSALLKNFSRPILKGIDAGDHPPITPSKVATSSELRSDQWKLYELICTNFFASLAPSAEYDSLTYKIDINGEIFEESSTKVTKEGFFMFLPHKRKNIIKDFPLLKENAVYPIKALNYDSKWTEAPSYLTESDLIKKMEENHIGTDASMPVHIENICQRNYVKVDQNRRLIPTKLGKALIEALSEVDQEIIHPDNRAKIESFVEEVAKGKNKYETVLKYALDLYLEKYEKIRVQIDKLYKGFQKYFTVDTSKVRTVLKNIKEQNNKYKNTKRIVKNESEINSDLNECDECHKGKMYIEYDQFDKFCIFCTKCERRTKVVRDAIIMNVDKSKQCDKCKSYLVYVEVENPFANGDTKYTGCLFCDRCLCL